MMRNIFIIGLLIIMVGCNKPADNNNMSITTKKNTQPETVVNENMLWGVWHRNGTEKEEIPTSFGVFEARGSWLVIHPEREINDLGYHVSITEIKGDYPLYELHVECGLKTESGYNDLNENEKPEWHSGIIGIHFLNENQIWFENKLGDEFTKRIKGMRFSMRFGKENVYYRSERIDK